MTFAKLGVLVEGTDYTISNLPAGLQATVILSSDVTAMIAMSGKAPQSPGFR